MRKSASFFVAPSGSDDHQGSELMPFRTLARAQQAVREEIREGMWEDVTVYLRDGLYPMESVLRFDERDSGRNGCRVVYRSAPGEQPILAGGRVITGWQRYNDTIWRVKLEPGRSFQTLYADGKRITKARLPAAGYYLTDEHTITDKTGISIKPGDIPSKADLSSAQVFVWPGEGEWNWFSETKPIRSFDPQHGRIDFESPCTWDIGSQSRYYIQGSLGFLRQSGQFHLDESEGILYYWPSTGTPEQQTVIAPAANRLLELNGRGQAVENIFFSGVTLECTDFYREYRMMMDNAEREEHRDGMIYVNRARDIEISGCVIRNAGSSGIFLDRYAQNIVIDGNRIEHIGHIGIHVCGFAPGEGDFASAEQSYTNKGHSITNNTIRYGGEMVGHGCGILLFQSGDNDVSHNLIEHMPRYGISLKGLRHKAMPATLYGTPVTWENHWDFLHSRNNRISYNDISHVMEDSQDGGLIESWGAGRGNVIHGNRLHHSGIHFSFGFGIYLDDASDDFTVTHNVLDHLYQTGEGKLWMLIFSKGIGNRIRNNLLVANPDAVSAVGTQEMADEENKGVLVERNIIVDSGMIYYFVNWRPDRFEAADCNLYWRGGTLPSVGGELPLPPAAGDLLGRHVYDWDSWKSLSGGKFDGGSCVADPVFVDEAGGDYRLKPESPAYMLGWNDIEWEKIGPRSGSFSQKS